MRRILQVLLLLLFCGISGSCGKPIEPLRVGVLMWPPWELAFLARENGHIDPRHIEVIDYQTPSEMVRGYRFGLIDAMFVASQFVIANADDLLESRIVHVIDFSNGGDALVAASHIESVEDLRGRNVGVEAGPLAVYMLERAFEGTDMTRDDINIVYMETQDHRTALETGQVDAVSTYEPTQTKLLAAGARILFDSRQMPLEIIDALVASPDAIAVKTPQLVEFVKGLEAARLDYLADRQAAATYMAAREKILVPDFITAMDGVTLLTLEDNVALMTGTDPRLIQGLEKQIAVLKAAGVIESEPAIASLLYPGIVTEAAN